MLIYLLRTHLCCRVLFTVKVLYLYFSNIPFSREQHMTSYNVHPIFKVVFNVQSTVLYFPIFIILVPSCLIPALVVFKLLNIYKSRVTQLIASNITYACSGFPHLRAFTSLFNYLLRTSHSVQGHISYIPIYGLYYYNLLIKVGRFQLLIN